jgi:hypothetical protein
MPSGDCKSSGLIPQWANRRCSESTTAGEIDHFVPEAREVSSTHQFTGSQSCHSQHRRPTRRFALHNKHLSRNQERERIPGQARTIDGGVWTPESKTIRSGSPPSDW